MVQFPHIRVVDASAGSGKTQQLALRAINLIFARGIKEMLAVTFTNDATREMRQRILEMLKKATLEDKNSGEDEKIIRQILEKKLRDDLDEKKIKKEAALAIDNILKNYLDFRVSTIDSFVNSICSASALELDLPPRYEIVMDARPYIEYAVDLVISGVGSRTEAEDFQKFLKSYLILENQKSWNPRNAIIDKVKTLREKENVEGAELRPSVTSFADDEEFFKQKDRILQELSKIKDKIIDEKTIKVIDGVLSEEDFLGTDLYKCTDNLPAGLKKDLEDFYFKLSGTRYREYINILQKIKNELNKIKSKESINFVDELNFEIKGFMEKENIVPGIYCMLGEDIKHYLIDEFQDTSNLQWHDLFPLVENALSEGGSLFYVGDKKQAVYRFRGGNVQLFDSAKNEFPSVKNKEDEILEENYRSKEEIVNENNELFSEKNLESFKNEEKIREILDVKDIDEIIKSYSGAAQKVARIKNSEGGIVTATELTASNKKDLYAKQLEPALIPMLKDTLKRHKSEDIAFLVMSNEEVEMLTSWLSQNGYQVNSQVTMDIRESKLILEIVSFLKFLNSPSDNLSFSAFLCGEVFQKAANRTREEVFEILRILKGKRLFYAEFRKNYPLEWKTFFEHFFKKAGFLPPYDLISEFIRVYGIAANFPGQESFVMHLLEIVSSLEKIGENSMQSFLDRWDTSDEEDRAFMVVLPSCPGAVRVTTVFKAKGLGFSVVFLIFLRHSKTENDFVVREADSITMKYIKREYAAFSEKLEELDRDEKRRKFIDDLNSLYVGMTRAEDELHVFVCSTRQSRNDFKVLFSGKEFIKSPSIPPLLAFARKQGGKKGDCKEESLGGDEGKKPEKIMQESVEQKTEIKETPQWGKRIIRRISGTERFREKRMRENIKRGELIHSVLSSIGMIEGGFAEVGSAREELIRAKLKNAATEQKYTGDTKEAEGIILKLLSDKEIRKWFELEGQAEKEVCSAEGEMFRMDRIIFGKELIEILDFKTGEAYKEEHKKQVKNYMSLVSGIYPEKKIRGYIIYAEENSVVEVNES